MKGLILCPGFSLDLLPPGLHAHTLRHGVVISCSKVYQTKWAAHWGILIDHFGPEAVEKSNAPTVLLPSELFTRYLPHVSTEKMLCLPPVDHLKVNLSSCVAMKLAAGFHDGSFWHRCESIDNANSRPNPVSVWGIIGMDGQSKPNTKPKVHYAKGIPQPKGAKPIYPERVDKFYHDVIGPMARARRTRFVNLSPHSVHQAIPRMSFEKFADLN